jgi:RNA polymerase sigma-70 factor, ECF subfamily
MNVELALSILPRNSIDRRGDFERIMAEHERLVLRVAWRLLGRMEDAQDAAQEVFLRLFRHFDELGCDPKPWLYRVTVNVCNDYHRRRMPEGEARADLADAAPDPLRILTLAERKRLLMEALQTLGEKERAAITLRDVEGLSTSEVAAILGVEEVTVRSQISMAKVKLAKYVRSRK